jgi:predicted dehydrogenase
MLTCRRVGDGRAACSALRRYDHPVLQQILYRVIRQLAGYSNEGRTLGVGILGYAPSVGKYHGLAIEAASGLKLRGICDLSPERLAQARSDFSDVDLHEDAGGLLECPDTDLVIIATPPNTHAALALKMMESGKHVVSEKPLALNREETDRMVEFADKKAVHLSCHQNRRFDGDYLAIRRAVERGLIGTLFYMETFVGDFHHPCGYWHSHDAVSGGTTYDWGAHYLDWTVSLIRDPLAAVIGTRQNRVWHDVTNADQERIQIRFASGKEAEFIHSDVAAIRKPKWYLLGTEGAIVGHWQDITAFSENPIHYYDRYDIPATEMPPELILIKRNQANPLKNAANKQVLNIPEQLPYPFHRNLSDHLLLGEPLAAPLSDSLKVVAILEAAARSADKGGTVEVLHE